MPLEIKRCRLSDIHGAAAAVGVPAGPEDSDLVDCCLMDIRRAHCDDDESVALALALELDLDGVRDLIGRAGYTLTRASRVDIIVEYFIENADYDIFKLNETLFAFDQPLLGGMS